MDKYDFRRVVDYAGFDICGIEKQAMKKGLKKSDVFCGSPHSIFSQGGSEFSSSGLGIPNDRAAILIYDSSMLEEAIGSDEMGGISDGYVFKDTKNKKGALLGVIRVKESLIDFEKELSVIISIDDKVSLLEREVFQKLNTFEDLKKTPYLSLNIVDLLYSTSVRNVTNPSKELTDRISNLKRISERLKYETRMIDYSNSMSSQIFMTLEAFRTNDKRRMGIMKTWPDFVIRTIQECLQEDENRLDKKYTDVLLAIIGEAKNCKEELGIN